MKNKSYKVGKPISISAVRRANDVLVSRNDDFDRLSGVSNHGRVAFKTIYSGRQYEINLSSAEIKEVYAKSVENARL